MVNMQNLQLIDLYTLTSQGGVEKVQISPIFYCGVVFEGGKCRPGSGNELDGFGSCGHWALSYSKCAPSGGNYLQNARVGSSSQVSKSRPGAPAVYGLVIDFAMRNSAVRASLLFPPPVNRGLHCKS